jgi:hypothetical protein
LDPNLVQFNPVILEKNKKKGPLSLWFWWVKNVNI